MRFIVLPFVLACATPPVPDTPSYAVDVAPVLERHCTRCHTAEGRRDGGVELDRLASARSARVRSACTSIEPVVAEQYADALVSDAADPGTPHCDGWRPMSMPPGAIERLTFVEQELLARWVATGAQP